MGGSPFGDAATFLIRTLFDLYVFVVMLRFLLQLMRADFYNPISQFVVRATQPLLRPMRRMITGLGSVDLASLVLMLALGFVKIALVAGVHGRYPSTGAMLILAVADMGRLLLNVFFWAVVIRVVVSWVNPGALNPFTQLLQSLTEPLLARARRVLPPMSGFDLSPIPVLILLQLAQLLVVTPIRSLASF